MTEITAGQLAARLHLTLRGNANRLLTAAAALEDAGPDQLSFVGAAKYFEAGLASSAGCVIAPPDYPGGGTQVVIESPQPRGHFAEALTLLYPAEPAPAGIHPSAVIAPGAGIDPTASIGPFVTIAARARIGARVRVGSGSFVGADSSIGDDTVLYARATVYARVTVGARCVLHSGCVLGADGFGFEMIGGAWRKVPQVGTVEIGNDVEIGAASCVDRATLGATVIGSGSKLDNMVHVGHNCRIGKHVVVAAQTGFAGGVTIGDYAVIGGQVGVGDKARIESKAIVGSGAGILTSKIVRAGEPVWGTPARPLKQYLAQLAAVARLGKKK